MKTPAQYQREYRERLKVSENKKPDVTHRYLSTPFHQYRGNPWDVLTVHFAAAGIDAPDYSNDGDTDPEWQEEDGPNRGSIGRAERIVGQLLDAAGELAKKINDFKTEEIDTKIVELEASDLSDPKIKKQALAEIVTLSKIRDRLSKQVRWSLPEWMVK